MVQWRKKLQARLGQRTHHFPGWSGGLAVWRSLQYGRFARPRHADRRRRAAHTAWGVAVLLELQPVEATSSAVVAWVGVDGVVVISFQAQPVRPRWSGRRTSVRLG